ncbi:MAG TPA: SDR family oxidoreductase [Solirubrobacteraceae bacterium]|jgi:nucleoside-diphosphate-sugar epimerase
MTIAIAGAHGKIAIRLTKRLAARGEEVVGLIRNPAHAEDIAAIGARPVVCDLEHATVAEIAAAISGSSAAVFAAGAGPGSGAERKLTVDRDGAIKLLAACASAAVPRYLLISSIGAEDPPESDDVFSVYLRAKAEADMAAQESDRDWTIVRPGGLTDEPGRGRVRIDTDPFRGEVPRDDVAAVLDALLQRSDATHVILYVNAGEQPVEEALEAVLAEHSS